MWWESTPDRLSEDAKDAIDRAGRLGICTVSCWEVAMLVLRGRIELDRPTATWVRHSLAGERVEPVPLTSDIAVAAALLDPVRRRGRRDEQGFAGDPADRFIYATARAIGAPLVTRDERLRSFDPQRTVW